MSAPEQMSIRQRFRFGLRVLAGRYYVSGGSLGKGTVLYALKPYLVTVGYLDSMYERVEVTFQSSYPWDSADAVEVYLREGIRTISKNETMPPREVKRLRPDSLQIQVQRSGRVLRSLEWPLCGI